MKNNAYLVNNEISGEQLLLHNLKEVKTYLSGLVKKSVIKKNIFNFQPWFTPSDPYECRTDQEFISKSIQHLCANSFNSLYLEKTRWSGGGPQFATVKPILLQPKNSQYEDLYNDHRFGRQDQELITNKRLKTKNKLYIDIKVDRSSINGYFSDKKDHSFHLYIYHDGNEKTIDLLKNKLTKIIIDDSIPKSWFPESADFSLTFSPPFYVTERNINRFDQWVKKQRLVKTNE
jgi:hypothetical protein